MAILRAGPAVPVVVVTPMLPRTYARLRAALGPRFVASQSSVTAYTKGGERPVTRYWISKRAQTLLDEPRAPEPALTALVDALRRAGIEARAEPGVQEMNAATTLVFLPFMLALDAAGSIDALMADAPLLATMFRAATEARALADRCGKIAFWAGLLSRFLGPHTIRIGLALARRQSPEGLAFVEEHFGTGARAQNADDGAEEAVSSPEERGRLRSALGELLARLA